jgi:uncharacterized paraquat-inducible protein A
MSELTGEQIDDLKILACFIKLYCHAKHDRKVVGERAIPEILQQGKGWAKTICVECAELLEHGMKKRAACPLDPKPTCKSCHVHCYSSEQRQKVREIMAYSGKRMILRGRLDYLWHYFIKS